LLPLIGSDLRAKLPSSRARVFSRIALFDLVWAGISPILAFLIRDGSINRIDSVAVYCCIALVVSVIVFQWFKISSPIPTFFSVHDALTITQACLTAVALAAAILFVFTRLEDAPRSVPIIHFFVLTGGLVAERAVARLVATRRAKSISLIDCQDIENILVIGASRLAWFFSKMLEEFSSHERRIVSILDERPWLYNRTLNGFSIIGSPANLSKIIDEYATHGIEIGKVVIAEHRESLKNTSWEEISKTCSAKNIPIEFLHERLLFSHTLNLKSLETPAVDVDLAASFSGPVYWKIKRLLDIIISLATTITISPLAMLVAALVLVDVGFPIVFWQQRLGQFGRPLYVYKFRTMRNSISRDGQLIPEAERLSLFGRLLRRNRLDEIPQLLNILVGSMSIVGPRPLLPVDQPKNIQLRLQVRPGLTGLAQINGGKLLTADEKDALDEWYVRHVSLLLDIKIVLRTLWVIVRGDHRNNAQISAALAERHLKSNCVTE